MVYGTGVAALTCCSFHRDWLRACVCGSVCVYFVFVFQRKLSLVSHEIYDFSLQCSRAITIWAGAACSGPLNSVNVTAATAGTATTTASHGHAHSSPTQGERHFLQLQLVANKLKLTRDRGRGRQQTVDSGQPHTHTHTLAHSHTHSRRHTLRLQTIEFAP